MKATKTKILSHLPTMAPLAADNIRDAIRDGAPKYNQGDHKYCLDRYIEVADNIANEIGESFLDGALVEAKELRVEEKFGEGAWVLRHAFDIYLDNESTSTKNIKNNMLTTGSSSDGWQDEQEQAQNDVEKGRALADTFHVLQSYVKLTSTTWSAKTYPNSFRASEAIDVLMSLRLSPSRKIAIQKVTRLWKCGFIISVSHSDEATFRDGHRVYRWASKAELQKSLDYVLTLPDVSIEGSDSHLMMASLSASLEETNTSSAILPFASAVDQTRGLEIATFCSVVEPLIEVADRPYHFRTYDQCFVGKDAVTALVSAKVVSNREDAVRKMNELCSSGLIYHVTQEHMFRDGNFFYRFSSASEVQQSIEAFSILSDSAPSKEMFQYAALIKRHEQVTGTLNIKYILNQFYGCDDKEGWDLSDLENWRLNMKRWGFGRRTDQDDDMVRNLSPLLRNIDPETWDVSGDPEWESPFGILAQIALFDQISRSAFRGTPNAFKWDELAKRATKVAIEKGYFESAYKSTLNQFVILLPLEHSEDWEDQKLGVSLLLNLLSKVAVLDEGYTDYEIVKRLEFSKRLSVAFLEHAQVVRKFHRYPHRNRAQGRTTTLEERIWLASDLVPRWAKSQNPESEGENAKKFVQLPTIPLKRLTRGR